MKWNEGGIVAQRRQRGFKEAAWLRGERGDGYNEREWKKEERRTEW